VDSLVADVKQQLGLEGRKLTAHLYKLLVYEEGSFFLPHRDGEKLDGMVATLVIALPAVHEGGELIVSHEGRSRTITMAGAASGLELSFAAFYADCEHEVRPLKSGYRLCLTYNVTLEKARGKKSLGAPSYGETVTALAELLREWSTDAAESKLAVTLDHRYTQDGLTIDRLKGVDRARAGVLFEAAEQADCVAHLALVTLWQSGSAEGDYGYSYGWGRGYRRSYDDYGDDEGDEEDYDDAAGDYAGDYKMGEIFDESLSASHWSDRDGEKIAIGEIDIDDGEVVSAIPPEKWEASREDFEGYTGNAGMTLERWYHRAAIMIWPRGRHFDVLCKAGTDASIGGFQVMIKRFKRAAKSRREELRDECLTFAKAIIDSWEPGGRFRWSSAFETVESIDRSLFLTLLCELDDVAVVRKFLSKAMTGDADVQLEAPILTFFKQHGWDNFDTELGKLVRAATVDTVPRTARLVEMLCVQRDNDPGRIKVCGRLCADAVTALINFDSSTKADDWDLRELDRAAILISLVKAMLAVEADKPLRQLIEHTLAASDKYDLTDAHLAAIFALKSQVARLSATKAALAHWLDACRSELASRTARAPEPPADFRREHKLSCKCADCSTLSDFLADPHERQLRLPLAEHRRRHLHQIIDSNHCDLTHETERRGRPYTLVCTKTTASYEAACKIYERDRNNLTRILKLMPAVRRRSQ
jgi:hypothetical protein